MWISSTTGRAVLRVAALALLVGCSSGNSGDSGNKAGGAAANNSPGVAGTGSGGMTATPANTATGGMGATGSGGMGLPVGSGGMGSVGSGGSGPVAMNSGDASTPDMNPTDAGASNLSDAGSPNTGTGFIRGDDPTESSVLGTATGPYTVMSYTDGYRDGPDYADSTIFYPTDADPPFAAVAIVPGFVSPQSSIMNWGPFLASFGIVTMTIGTNSPTDDPTLREAALLDALETIKSENTRSGGPLENKIATDHLATMGWSMGGGGTLLAANDHPELKATVAMCAWNPGFQYSMDKVPSMMFASQGDPLAGGQSQGFYTSIPDSTPKLLVEFPGADHFVANDPVGQSGEIGKYGLSWLKVFLEGDERYRQFLLKMPTVMTTDWQSNLQ